MITFLQIWANLSQKIESIVFHLSLLPKLSLRPRPQQQAVYKSKYHFLSPYAYLSMPHTFINEAQNDKLLPLFLQKQNLNIHNMLHKHVQKHV